MFIAPLVQRAAILTAAVSIAALAPSVSHAGDTCSGYSISTGDRTISLNLAFPADDVRRIVVGACDAGGRCIRKDKEGDESIIDLSYVPGDPTASWTVVGGTGKYAASGGTGWYKQVQADGNVLVYAWGGNCQARTRHLKQVRMTKAELQSTFTSVLASGTCTDGTGFTSRYDPSGRVAHTTRSSGGQLLYEDDAARWSLSEDGEDALMCQQWSKGGSSCWKNSRFGEVVIAREVGVPRRTCWFTLTPQ